MGKLRMTESLVRHVMINQDYPVDIWPQMSYCGRVLRRFDKPVAKDVAKLMIEQEQRLQPCKHCMNKIKKDEKNK